MRLSPALAAVVDQGREELARAGEWPRAPIPFASGIPDEAVPVIRAWLDDGGYDEAIAQVTAEDPGLANQ